MESIKKILAAMKEVASHPGQAVKNYRQKTGQGVVGCFPIYCPEEIVHAAGMLPVGMWGGQTQISQALTIVPSFCCSIMQSNIELALKGVYKDLDAVIMSSPCDTLKSIPQDWGYVVPDIKVIQIVYPQMRKIEGGVEYLKTEFLRVKQAIEAITGEPITDAALKESIGVYNRHRRSMREFCSIARNYPRTITPAVRHLVIKSGYFMEKSQHAMLVDELSKELKKLPPEEWQGKKVVLTGITAEPDALLEIFDENQITVVADDLAQESRQFRTDVPAGEEPLLCLARQWSLIEGCSLAYDPQKKRVEMLIELVRETGADGLIFCMMKFCDPEEFDHPIIAEQFEAAGIPSLYLEIDQQQQSMERERTRIQSFAEMLNS
ncbi:2-hydroxyacyl-CoA dehydratase subunit D [Syntrophomonas curvata]